MHFPSLAELIVEKSGISGDLGMIIGSGLSSISNELTKTIEIPYQDLKNSDPDFVKGYPVVPSQRISTTLSKQLALYVVINSPLQMASDFIENYKKHPAFEFIKEASTPSPDVPLIRPKEV